MGVRQAGVTYLDTWNHAGGAVVAGRLVAACDGGGDEESKDNVAEVEHGCCWAWCDDSVLLVGTRVRRMKRGW